MFDDNRNKKEESERIKAIRAEQRLAAEKEEDEEDEEEDEEDSKPRKKKSKKPKEEVRNWNLGVSKNTLSYSPCLHCMHNKTYLYKMLLGELSKTIRLSFSFFRQQMMSTNLEHQSFQSMSRRNQKSRKDREGRESQKQKRKRK